MNILVVDDEAIIRQSFIKRISRLPLDFTAIYQGKNGYEALEIAQKYALDIVLIDINMPFLNGLDLIEELRKLDREVEIIIISGYDNFSYAQQAIRYHVSAYLLKPVVQKEFEETITGVYQKVLADRKREKTATFSVLALKIMKENISNSEFCLTDLAEKMEVSRSYLSKKLSEETEKSFVDLMKMLRIERAKSLLNELSYGTKIYEIAEMTGFKNQYYFSSVFRQETGYSPKEYRQLVK